MKTIAIIIALASFALDIQAQSTKVDDAVVFFGIDFTAAKLIGSEGFTDPQDIAANYFDKWNALMFDEQSKYNLPKALGNETVLYDFAPVTAHNSGIDPEELVINKSYEIDEERARQVLGALDMSESDYAEGQGFLMVVESLNKPEEMAYVWCILFDIESRDITYIEKCSGHASGFGIRNYWGNSFGRVLTDLRKKL